MLLRNLCLLLLLTTCGAALFEELVQRAVEVSGTIAKGASAMDIIKEIVKPLAKVGGHVESSLHGGPVKCKQDNPANPACGVGCYCNENKGHNSVHRCGAGHEWQDPVHIQFITAGSMKNGNGLYSDEELQTMMLNTRMVTGEEAKVLNFKAFPAAKWDQVSNELQIKSEPISIVHIVAHSGSAGIQLPNSKGGMSTVRPEFWEDVFRSLPPGQIKLVVLSSCTNEETSKAIKKHVPWVIGTLVDISSDEAMAFSGQLYHRLVAKDGVRKAFGEAHRNAQQERADAILSQQQQQSQQLAGQQPQQAVPEMYKLFEQQDAQADFSIFR